jgi:ketosteroid isomerase-like protein
MKKLTIIILFILPLRVFAQDRQQIEKLRNNWAIFLQNKQLANAMGQYADDAVFYSPDGQNAKGKKEIMRLYQMVMKQYNSRINFHSDGILISGDVASDSGDYEETLQDNSTHKSMKLKGSYLLVLQKQRSGWKISRMMWTEKKG